ncbi:hypothetical protein HL666_14875 [Bradyrhizobium sp. 83002]|uniref:hypothetical protein n=1 Tax=Bradyrhizobium aeschynomenes TaxID=2734909 RepID=UPI001551B938|nr:hypothetical protein [Bradyrhizobium aeschynomenes]NPU12053.1 hypothetical protein [Bradyrhizobium aeschynomenes]
MSGKEMAPWGTAIVSDLLSLAQVPGGSVLGKLGDRYLEQRRAEAAKILIEELSKGSSEPINFAESDVDPMIEITYRFAKAVADGAAKENLRLLAQVIAGLKRNKALDPDKFRKWANILEQLTRDELMLIGKAIAIRRKITAAGIGAPNDFWQQLTSEMTAGRYSRDEINSLCTAVCRTGLLIQLSALSDVYYTAMPWLDELAALADVEGIVNTK